MSVLSDVLYLGIALLFFVLSYGLIVGLERLMIGGQGENRERNP